MALAQEKYSCPGELSLASSAVNVNRQSNLRMQKSHVAHGQTDESLIGHITVKYIAFPSFTIIFLPSISTRPE